MSVVKIAWTVVAIDHHVETVDLLSEATVISSRKARGHLNRNQ